MILRQTLSLFKMRITEKQEIEGAVKGQMKTNISILFLSVTSYETGGT